jgi:hypothetical protein
MSFNIFNSWSVEFILCVTAVCRHDIAEILLKVALNTKNQINYNKNMKSKWMQTERIQSDDSHIDLWSMRTKNSSTKLDTNPCLIDDRLV